MLTLFHAPWTRSGRIMWLLEEAGADYVTRYVEIARRDGTGARDPANPHPDGKVPCISHDGVVISESLAIALYLTDLQPQAGLGAPVGSPERGAYLTWLAWIAGELEPALWSKISGAINGDPVAQARYDAVVARLLGALELGRYLMGDRFTAIDVMVGSALAWASEHLPASDLLDGYIARVTDRPANRRAMDKDAPVEAAA